MSGGDFPAIPTNCKFTHGIGDKSFFRLSKRPNEGRQKQLPGKSKVKYKFLPILIIVNHRPRAELGAVNDNTSPERNRSLCRAGEESGSCYRGGSDPALHAFHTGGDLKLAE